MSTERPDGNRSDVVPRDDVPIACSLSVDAVPARLDQWKSLLSGAELQELAGGVRFTLPIDTSITALQLCLAEQDCCPFFEFTLRLDRSRLHLDVEAPAPAQELLDELVKLVT